MVASIILLSLVFIFVAYCAWAQKEVQKEEELEKFSRSFWKQVNELLSESPKELFLSYISFNYETSLPLSVWEVLKKGALRLELASNLRIYFKKEFGGLTEGEKKIMAERIPKYLKEEEIKPYIFKNFRDKEIDSTLSKLVDF